jgi:flagellar biogenesis protein FliO
MTPAPLRRAGRRLAHGLHRAAWVLQLLLLGTWAQAQQAPGAASAPPLVFKAESDASLPGPQQWIVATLLCFAALFAAVWWLRRQHGLPRPSWGSGPDRLITVVARTALTQQTQLLVVDHGQRRLLLSVGPAGTQVLRDDPHPDLPPAQPAAPATTPPGAP